MALSSEECKRQLQGLVFDVQRVRSIWREGLSEEAAEFLLSGDWLFSEECEMALVKMASLRNPTPMETANFFKFFQMKTEVEETGLSSLDIVRVVRTAESGDADYLENSMDVVMTGTYPVMPEGR